MKLLARAAWCFVGALLLLSFGCAQATPLPTPQLRDGAEQAVHIIWAEVYGRMDRPPRVRWVQGKALSCTDPNSGRPGFPQFDEEARPVCREGLTMSPLECMVAYRPDDLSFSTTTLAHELQHVLQARQFRADPQHYGPEWKAIEECGAGAPLGCGIVDLANRAIVGAGL